MLIKSILLVIIAILIRGTLPRYRVDQLITLNWKSIIFLCLFLLLLLLLLLIIL